MEPDDLPTPAKREGYSAVIETLGWELAERYVAGECGPEERKLVQRWQADPKNAAVLTWLKSIRETSHALAPHRQDQVDASAAWAKWQHLASSATTPVESSASVFRMRTIWFGAAAAVAVCALFLIARPLSTNVSRVVATAAGQRSSITLSDGTHVQLAPMTTLRVAFGPQGRQVELDGEAYFSVVHNVRHPFFVLTHNVEITDVGTEFDVRAYDDGVRVAVARGSVVVGAGQGTGEARARPARPSPTPNLPFAQDIPLSAGDMADVVNGVPTVTHHSDIAAMTAWLQGRLVFNGTSLTDVLREIERTFDIKITVSDTTLIARRTLTASFTTESVDRVLDEVTQALGARYQRSGRSVMIEHKPSEVRNVGTSFTWKNQ